MVQIINRAPTFAQTLGANLGTGLGQGLHALAQHKMQNMQRQKMEQDFNPVFGPKAARFFSGLSPEERKGIFSQLDLGQFLGSAPQSGMTALQQPQQQPQQQNGMEALISQHPQEFQAMAQENNMAPAELLGELSKYPEAARLFQERVGYEAPVVQQQQQQVQPQVQQQAEINPFSSKAAKHAAMEEKKFEQGEKKRLQQADIAERQLALKEKQIEENREDALWKEAAPVLKSQVEGARDADENLRLLTDLQNLEQTNNLDTAGWLSMMEGMGMDSISALLSPESQQHQKITTGFVKNMKKFFGGRITDYEVKTYLKTLPNLLQSPEGRKRVIADMKYFYNAAKVNYDAGQEVIKEHGGKPPRNFDALVYEKTQKKTDTLAKKFKEDMALKVPEAQATWKTMSMAVAGKAAGLIPSVVKEAIKSRKYKFLGKAIGGKEKPTDISAAAYKAPENPFA